MPIFAEILRRDHIDLDRSFFELGGHSLLAIRLLARLHADRPDLQLTLATLFASAERTRARSNHPRGAQPTGADPRASQSAQG